MHIAEKQHLFKIIHVPEPKDRCSFLKEGKRGLKEVRERKGERERERRHHGAIKNNRIYSMKSLHSLASFKKDDTPDRVIRFIFISLHL